MFDKHLAAKLLVILKVPFRTNILHPSELRTHVILSLIATSNQKDKDIT